MAGTSVESSTRSYGVLATARRGRRGWAIWVASGLFTLNMAGDWIGRGSPVRHETTADAFWHIGRPAAIAVHEGRSIIRVPTPSPGTEVLVVVSSLARVAWSVPDPAHCLSRERSARA